MQRLREISEAAKSLADDRAFKVALADLRGQWYGELMALTGGGARQDELCTRLRVLSDFNVELGNLVEAHRRAVEMGG